MQNSAQKNDLPELYSMYSPSYQKCSPSFIFLLPLSPAPMYGLAYLFTQKVGREQKNPHFPHHKNPYRQIEIFK